MTTNTPWYTDPALAAQYTQGGFPNAGAGTGTYARNISQFKRKLLSVLLTVITAGTATAHTAAIMIGTATVGSVAMSTNTALYQTRIEIATASRAVAANAVVATKLIGDDTGVVLPIYEFKVEPDTVMTDRS